MNSAMNTKSSFARVFKVVGCLLVWVDWGRDGCVCAFGVSSSSFRLRLRNKASRSWTVYDDSRAMTALIPLRLVELSWWENWRC